MNSKKDRKISAQNLSSKLKATPAARRRMTQEDMDGLVDMNVSGEVCTFQEMRKHIENIIKRIERKHGH